MGQRFGPDSNGEVNLVPDSLMLCGPSTELGQVVLGCGQGATLEHLISAFYGLLYLSRLG